MATSNDDELVTQTNHIINAIENHENRITRNEEDTKRLMDHIKGLENELLIQQDLQMIVARIFSIKTQAISIKTHLDGIEVGLYNLLKGHLTPFLVRIESIQKSLNELRNTLAKKGYLLSTYDASEALQTQASFVSFKNGSIIGLLHIPIFKSQSALYVYKCISTPLISSMSNVT